MQGNYLRGQLIPGFIAVVDTWGQGGNCPPIFQRTIVFCSKTMGKCDIILSKQ